MNNQINDQDSLLLIELAHKTSLADGVCSSEEYSLLERYQQELGIDYFPDTHTVDELIDYFSKREQSVQKKVWLQLYSLIIADHNFDDNEKELISRIKSSFSISPDEFDKISQAVDNLNDAYLKLYEALE